MPLGHDWEQAWNIRTAHILAAIFAVGFAACVVKFRFEIRHSAPEPSSATKWRFRVAAVGCLLYLFLAVPHGIPSLLGSFLFFLFLVWPVFALWVMAAPLPYRGGSAYLLSGVAALSVVFWYVYWRNSGL
jgi:hypothetical protein